MFARRHLAALVVIVLFPSWLFAGNSNSLMDVSPDGKRLLVTNADNGTVTVVDLEGRKALREIAVGDKPEGVTWIGAGPLAAVTVFRDDLVVFFNTQDGTVLKKLTVADEPYGIVANAAGTRAWVTHDYPGVVTEIDLKEMKPVRELQVVPFIRGIALANDEARLYVTGYYNAALYAVDLGAGKVVDQWPGIATDNLARHVLLHPSRPKAYVSHLRSKIEVADGSGSIFPILSVADLTPPGEGKRRKSFGMDTFNGLGVPTNPWESAMSPDGKRFYLIYAGTNNMNFCQVVDDDYREIEGRGGFVNLGQNPRAVRVSPDGRFVYVSNTLDFNVTVHDGETMRKLETINVCDPPKTPEWVRGKILFNTSNPPLTARRWIACASCHPDGHHDGRTWHNPEGLRKTTALFGMAHTHPLHWSADRDEAQDFEYTIRGRLMQGRGLLSGNMKAKRAFEPVELDEKLSGRSADLDALAIYCNTFEFTLSPHAAGPGKLSPAAERGKPIFFAAETQCATCHSGPFYSDSRLEKPYLLHDVGTGTDDPSEKMGPKYDTPTLLGVYRQTEYLHHGKAKTLRDVLTTFNKENRHGKTSHLKPGQIDDLVEFLKSLPYESSPAETPNTVKDRVLPKKN